MANSMATSDDLSSRLAGILPKDHRFHVFHISTPPTKCAPLYSPPPNERPDRTYCEKHFLAVSVDDQTQPEVKDAKRVLVLGVEIFIFTTAHATTIFVAKADSTGYLHLLNLPRGTPSPIREICAAFVAFLVEKRRRDGVQLVVSLFARSQAQYLFPGSVDNNGKHVLDDRALVKWWCRVLDPLLLQKDGVSGYIVVPGLDAHETRAYVPRGATASGRWIQGHPLELISHYTREFDWVPPRCLIPKFPDDPKSRFRDELDEEAARSGIFRTTGSWKSVKNLETFWELMAFRQECSSGRMTGFIWLVFGDEKEAPAQPGSHAATLLETPKTNRTVNMNITPSTTPRKLFPKKSDSAALNQDPEAATANSKPTEKPRKKKKSIRRKLSGPIIARVPKIKKAQRNYLLDQPASTAYYSWTPSGRGERIYSETDYKRIIDMLLHLEFSTLEKAAGSTRRWLAEVGMDSSWGYLVTGTRALPSKVEGAEGTQEKDSGKTQVNNLTGLVKRKRIESTSEGGSGNVNTLSAGLIRKKPKAESQQAQQPPAETAVNTLGDDLVKKKSGS